MLKESNPKCFWKLLEKLGDLDKNPQKHDNISVESWLNHFKCLNNKVNVEDKSFSQTIVNDISSMESLDDYKHIINQDFTNKEDPRLATVKIANYLNRNLSDEVIDKITEYCSFKKMKKYMTNENNEGEYLRKGVIGDWKNHFTVAENEAFEKIYNEKMEGSGLKFDW
ncbi:sulfotransferase 1C2A-like [Saccoglossus kowalevskii]|uniref:Sulfotransferase 1C2A-like n=1 Tax=Saccoglossus kowalevskii TaxID=10224 RepID=A0ABM0M5L8_SACKO|nr:PREDICTED: sulfotransferase 1C2A-like [Saccoglossus kowalevskii]